MKELTKEQKFELLAKSRGMTTDELRAQFSSMGKKSPRVAGFDKNPERASAAGKLGVEAKRKKAA